MGTFGTVYRAFGDRVIQEPGGSTASHFAKMSPLGQKQRLDRLLAVSGLPQQADLSAVC
jgi:hypothetical protein